MDILGAGNAGLLQDQDVPLYPAYVGLLRGENTGLGLGGLLNQNLKSGKLLVF